MIGEAAAAAAWLPEYGWGHVATFGGSEIGRRVAQKVLEITTRPAIERHVQHLIRRFTARLTGLVSAIRFGQRSARAVWSSGYV